MKELKHKQQIKVNSFRFQKEIVVGTQKGFYEEYSDKCKEIIGAFQEDLNDDYAWTVQAPSIIEGDYPGKEKNIANKKQRYKDAIPVEDDEIVLIDDRKFKVIIIGENYSNPIHFKRV